MTYLNNLPNPASPCNTLKPRQPLSLASSKTGTLSPAFETPETFTVEGDLGGGMSIRATSRHRPHPYMQNRRYSVAKDARSATADNKTALRLLVGELGQGKGVYLKSLRIKAFNEMKSKAPGVEARETGPGKESTLRAAHIAPHLVQGRASSPPFAASYLE